MKSRTLPIYKKWLATATEEQIEYVDKVYALCELNYNVGGDSVVECVDPDDVRWLFLNIGEVRGYCELKVESALNQRWGDDDDPQLDKVGEWRDTA
jgi:hypothetical protein